MRRSTRYFALLLACSLFTACNRPTAERHTANKPSLTTQTVASDEDTSNTKSESDVAQKNADVSEGVTTSKSVEPAEQQVTLKSVTPDKVRVGQSYQYEVHVTNHDAEAAVRDVKVHHTLPEGFSIESSEPKADSSEQEAVWTFSELGPGETRKIAITGSSDAEGMQQACLSVTYTPAVCITTEFVKPDIVVEKQAPETGTLCEPLTITYQVKNNGSWGRQVDYCQG